MKKQGKYSTYVDTFTKRERLYSLRRELKQKIWHAGNVAHDGQECQVLEAELLTVEADIEALGWRVNG